jgi:hypothetical protein
MSAKLNFNTHLLNIMFDFLSYLSAGPTLLKPDEAEHYATLAWSR